MSEDTLIVPAIKISNNQVWETEETVVRECILSISCNKRKLDVLPCSPSELKELTFGYLLNNNIINDIEEIISCKFDSETCTYETELKNFLNVETKNIQNATKLNPKPIISSAQITLEEAFFYSNFLQNHLPLFKETGGVHSGGLGLGSKVIHTSYDIGRYNVFDKLYGKAALQNSPLHNCLLFFSGRISSELLLRTAHMRIPILIARSAPTDLALSIAEELNITVIGFAKNKKMNIYTAKHRIIL